MIAEWSRTMTMGRWYIRGAFGFPVLWRPRAETFRMERVNHAAHGRMTRVGWLLWLLTVVHSDKGGNR